MAGENTASGEAKAIQADENGEGRERSTIGFPYNNLNDAIEVAQAIHTNVGTGDCDDTQLSAWMKLSPKSSGFRVQLAAAKLFGIIEGGSNSFRLSSLGRMIVDPQRVREAKVKAFLNVPLYKAVHEKYKGGVLPPAAAFQRDIIGLGVATKQSERARQVFERSAEQAGFFEHGKDRLVMPGIAMRGAEEEHSHHEEPKDEDAGNKGKGGSGGGGDLSGLNPFIQGLLQTLPETGTEWSAQDRAKWLQTAANIFDLIYKGDGGITVRAATAERSPRPD
jgi:hypothetical protein